MKTNLTIDNGIAKVTIEKGNYNVFTFSTLNHDEFERNCMFEKTDEYGHICQSVEKLTTDGIEVLAIFTALDGESVPPVYITSSNSLFSDKVDYELISPNSEIELTLLNDDSVQQSTLGFSVNVELK